MRYKKAVSTAICLQQTLVACYLSYGVVVAVWTNRTVSASVFHAWIYTFTLVYCDSSLSPILYCWKLEKVRKAVLCIVFRVRSCRCVRYNDKKFVTLTYQDFRTTLKGCPKLKVILYRPFNFLVSMLFWAVTESQQKLSFLLQIKNVAKWRAIILPALIDIEKWRIRKYR